MRKFYNNLAWYRIGELRSLGILALSVAFGLAGLLALSSCDDDEMQAEPVKMKGFYTSIDKDNKTDCTNEDLDFHLEGDVVVGKPNIGVTARGVDFDGATFAQIGIKVGKSDNNPETIVSAYVSQTGNVSDRPGAYFLAARNDTDIPVAEGQTIYTGYWTGYAYRPVGEKPVVICPYVLVPEGTEGLEEIPDGQCGMDKNTVHAALAKYLGDGNGNLRACHRLLDDNGILNPVPNQ